jgi:hypothetical protein
MSRERREVIEFLLFALLITALVLSLTMAVWR